MKMIIKVINMRLFLFDKRFAISGAMTLLLLMSLPWAVTACNGQKQVLNTSGAKNMNFRFEDYEKGEDAQKKLLELYPVGSDYKILADNLNSINKMNCGRAKMTPSLECEYLIPTSKFSSISWSISVFEDAGKITKIEAYRTLSYI
jgi:hypothetical protein